MTIKKKKGYMWKRYYQIIHDGSKDCQRIFSMFLCASHETPPKKDDGFGKGIKRHVQDIDDD